MTNTSIGAESGNGDALVMVFDEGVGGGDSENVWVSAGKRAALAAFVGSSGYVHSGLEFTGHDGTADQVDLTAGRGYVMASGVDVQGQTTSSEPSHNTTLSDSVPLVIEVPSTVTNLDMTASSLNDVWLAVDTDGTGPASQAGDVYVRHGTGLSAPGHPSVKIGQTNPDDATQDTRANDDRPLGTVSIDRLNGSYPSDVRGISASGVVASIDPSSSSNAVQDAIDAINADTGEGRVELPPTDIDVGSSITGRERIGIVGSVPRATVLLDQDPSTPMFDCSTAADGRNSYLHNLSLRTPGATASAPFFSFGSAMLGHNIGYLRCEFRRGSNVFDMTAGNVNSSQWQYIYATDYNKFLVGTPGPALSADTLYLNSDDSTTPEIHLNGAGGDFGVDHINKGGTACKVVEATGTNANYAGCGHIHFEPSTSASINAIIDISDRRRYWFPSIHNTSPDPSFGAMIDRLENAVIGRCENRGVEVYGDMFDTGGTIYLGPSSEITDNASQTGNTLSTDAITCLGDLTQLA